jgi:hypothetical protein
MYERHGHVKATEGSAAFGTPRVPTRPMTWSMTVKAKPHKPSEFESVLLAIAGHDLRQPLQVIQNVHDILGRGLRTASELRLLQYGQSAVERLRDQLDELLAALRLCESGKRVKLTSVRVEPLLQQATYANKVAALTKGVSVRTVPTSATINSNALLLGTVLRNLVSNAVKYTQPGGRILVGCRTPAGASVLTCMTPESELPGTRCLSCSMPSPVLILRDATVWASASSSCVRRSEYWDTASTSLPLPVVGPAFPFLQPSRKEVNERHLSHHRSNAKTHGNDEWEVFANSCDRSRF